MTSVVENIRRKKKKLVKDLGGKLLWSLEKMTETYSAVPTTPFLDYDDFKWIDNLEDNWRSIHRELDGILSYNNLIPSFQDISEDQRSISKDDNWKTFFLYGFGYKAGENCSMCPETTKLIEQVPGMITAFFSILKPGKHIPEHRGVFKGIVRYHLGLKVPHPAKQCHIRVAGQDTFWEEGKSILFDDTYPHEVWNETDGMRVVLLMDVIHPLRFPGSVINKTIINLIKHTGYVQDARKNQEAWTRKFRQYREKRIRSEV